MNRNHKARIALLVLLVLACALMNGCKKTRPEPTASPEPTPTATAAPDVTATPAPTPEQTAEPTATPSPEPTPEIGPALEWTTAGSEYEGENYHFSAQVPRFGKEEIDSYFEAKAARLYNGFLAELDETGGEGGESFELTYTVTYNRDGIISVVFQKYAFLGGAYPNVSYDCDTIDAERNSRLLLCDVVTDPGFAKLQQLAADCFPEKDGVDTGDLGGMIAESFSEDLFSLDETALHLYFPDYAFGYRGWTDVAVPYDALREAGILADWVAA